MSYSTRLSPFSFFPFHFSNSLFASITAHPESSLLHALVTDQRQVSASVLKQIVRYIEADDFKSAIHLLLTEKLKINCVKTPYSPYRELLFLSFVAFGRENIDQGKYILQEEEVCKSFCFI